MTPRFCSCSSYELFQYGCRCNRHKPRTMPVNLIIAELGFKRSWAVVRLEMTVIDDKAKKRMKDPTCLEDLQHLLWQIENYDVSLHDTVCRELEAEFKPPPIVETKTFYNDSSY
jgi:hypothetical protein